MLQTNIITQREKYERMTINVHRWMRLIKGEQYPTPHEFSHEADEGVSNILLCHFPPKGREERYMMSCPHAGGASIKYNYYLVGDKTSHLLGKNEFLMRMWLDKPSPPSVDGSNATGTQ
jgi:hypothetical protein